MEVDGRFPSLSNPLDPTGQGEKTSPVDRSRQGSGRAQDSGEFSGENVQLFMSELSGVSDVRQSRVEALKQAMAEGTYHVDAHEIAGAMLSQVLG